MELMKDISSAKEGSNKVTFLSPLLFYLAEDVLSRGISDLVSQGKLNLIKCTCYGAKNT